MSETPKRKPRRRVVGIVTSTKTPKTIVVRCDHTVQHPVFKKYIKRTSRYKAHDENCEAQVGDRVEIMETRPLSKTKNFRLLRVVDRARIPAETPEVDPQADLPVPAGRPSGGQPKEG